MLLRLIYILVLLMACSETERASDAGGLTDSTPMDDVPTLMDASTPRDASIPDDLGLRCVGSCDSSLSSCAIDTSQCSDVCLFVNGASNPDAYCSYACDVATCPLGWTCLPSADERGRYCFADAARCGDSIVQRREECDEGSSNGEPGAMCNSDCESVSISSGEATFTMDGLEHQAEGTSEDWMVRATLLNTPEGEALRATFEMSTGWELSLRVLIDDIPTPLPSAVPARVSLVVFAGAALCFYSPSQFDFEAVVTITEHEANHFVGSFDTVVTYDASCGSVEPATPPTPFMREITESHFAVTATDERESRL